MKNYLIQFIALVSLTLWVSSCSKDNPEEEEKIKQDIWLKQEDIGIVDDAVKIFMDNHNVPGLVLAVTKDEKLVYAKAYGKADKEANTDMKTNSIFRLASVSKSITGVAVMKLIDDKKLDIDDKVFGSTGILKKYRTVDLGERLHMLTVRHLLNHTSGGWGNSVTDPVFYYNRDVTKDELIDKALVDFPLTRNPGTYYDYSNLGYMLLDKIVEEVSGQPYENYVKDAVLRPIGITTVSGAGNTLADRKTNEVKYYGTDLSGSDPYIYNYQRMIAGGGWSASAPDLAKFLVHVDGYSKKRDILSSDALQLMLTVPSVANPGGYGAGWSVRNDIYWHVGSLPGVTTEIARNNNGMNGVILINTRGDMNTMTRDMDILLWNTILRNTNIQWHDIEQF